MCSTACLSLVFFRFFHRCNPLKSKAESRNIRPIRAATPVENPFCLNVGFSVMLQHVRELLSESGFIPSIRQTHFYGNVVVLRRSATRTIQSDGVYSDNTTASVDTSFLSYLSGLPTNSQKTTFSGVLSAATLKAAVSMSNTEKARIDFIAFYLIAGGLDHLD